MNKHHPGYISRKTGQDSLKNREIFFFSFRSVSTRPELENSKIIPTKFKKLKNIIQASFQAETGWDRPKNREKKFRSDLFQPDPS